ncbi:MAG: ATP-binding protein [Caldilineaceae bacterium]
MSESKTLAALGGAIAFIFLGIGAYQVMQNQDVIEMCVPGVLVLVAIPLTVWVAKTALAEIKSTADWWHNRSMAQDLHQVNLAKAQMDLHLISPDSAGLLPVSRAILQNGMITNQVLMLAAQHVQNGQPVQPVPTSITYSPHVAYRNDVKAEGSAQLPALAAVQTKSFLDLFNAGQLPSDKFLLGYDLESGEMVTATWRDLYSALIGGQSGAGKSTLIRNVLAQSALQGGRFVVLDPHYEAGEESLGQSLSPLRSLMLCDVAHDEKTMVDALKFVRSIGQRRLHGEDQDKTPLVLIVDETTGLLQRSNVADELQDVLGMISQETRKVGVYAMCIGQQFKSDVMNTTVRNSFVSMLSCRARKDVARVMSGNNEFAEVAQNLTIGQCVWMQPCGNVTKIAVPNCTQDMVTVVAKSIEKPAKTGTAALQVVEPVPLPVPLPVPTVNEGRVEWCEAEPATTDARAARAIQMYAGGATMTEIIADVWGITSKGRAWQEANGELNAILQRVVAGSLK